VVVLHTLQATLHNAHDDDDDDDREWSAFIYIKGVHFNSNFGCKEHKRKYLMKLISKQAIGYNQSVGHWFLTLLITFNLGFLQKNQNKIISNSRVLNIFKELVVNFHKNTPPPPPPPPKKNQWFRAASQTSSFKRKLVSWFRIKIRMINNNIFLFNNFLKRKVKKKLEFFFVYLVSNLTNFSIFETFHQIFYIKKLKKKSPFNNNYMCIYIHIDIFVYILILFYYLWHI